MSVEIEVFEKAVVRYKIESAGFGRVHVKAYVSDEGEHELRYMLPVRVSRILKEYAELGYELINESQKA